MPAWKAGDLLPLCRVPWEEQGISGFPGTSKQTVWPGKWDLTVKGGPAAHLPALPNTPIIYETNLLSPCAGSCRDRPCGTCPGVVCFFSPDRLTPWCSAFHRGIRGDLSRSLYPAVLSAVLLLSPSPAHPPLSLANRAIRPSAGRVRGRAHAAPAAGSEGGRQPPAVGLGHSRSSAWQRSVSEGSDTRRPSAL